MSDAGRDPGHDTEHDAGRDETPDAVTEPEPELEPAAAAVAAEPVVPPMRARTSRRLALLSVAVAVVVIALDVVTKRWAVSSLSHDNDRHVVWKLHWNLVYNSGMAFSRGRGLGPLIALVAIVVVVALVVGSVRVDTRLGQVAVGLILGGAVGNIVDRIFRGGQWLHGSVIDFIDFRFFPVFNVADIGVDVGAALFALTMLLASRHERAAATNGDL